MSDGLLLLITGALLSGGLAVSLLAGRLRVPGLVLVLGLGMAIGSDGFGWIAFNDYRLARRIGIVALSLILFEGTRGRLERYPPGVRPRREPGVHRDDRDGRDRRLGRGRAV